MNMVKRQAIRLIENMPEQTTWDDIMYEIYVKKKITKALKSVQEGKTITHKELKRRFNVK